MRYILMVNAYVEPEHLQKLLDRVVGPDAKDTIMTAGERLIQQGEERGILKGIQQGEERGILKGIQQGEERGILKGIQQGEERGILKGIQQGEERGILKGIQQGEERGILQGKRDMLLLLLQQRFGSQVSTDVERRLATASAEQITAWASRVMSAATLADLLAG